MVDLDDNPWLSIPAADYEGHMGPEGVGQLAVLADLLGQACQELQPRRVLVLGCATGNGFDRVDPKVTDWLIGVDLNPEYLALARARYAASWFGRLELIGTDIEDLVQPPQSQDLVFAGLIFESSGWLDGWRRAERARWCCSSPVKPPPRSRPRASRACASSPRSCDLFLRSLSCPRPSVPV